VFRQGELKHGAAGHVRARPQSAAVRFAASTLVRRWSVARVESHEGRTCSLFRTGHCPSPGKGRRPMLPCRICAAGGQRLPPLVLVCEFLLKSDARPATVCNLIGTRTKVCSFVLEAVSAAYTVHSLPRLQPNSGYPSSATYNWPKSDKSDFGWRDREGACNNIDGRYKKHSCAHAHPLPRKRGRE
jgi:hypothetical protein